MVEFEAANTDDKTNSELEIRYMTDLMAVCGTECLADVHIMSHDEYNGVSFYHLLVLISRMDMDKFDSIWFMFSTYNMDGNFFIMEDTVAINDDSSSVFDAQSKLNPTSEPFTTTTVSLPDFSETVLQIYQESSDEVFFDAPEVRVPQDNILSKFKNL